MCIVFFGAVCLDESVYESVLSVCLSVDESVCESVLAPPPFLGRVNSLSVPLQLSSLFFSFRFFFVKVKNEVR